MTVPLFSSLASLAASSGYPARAANVLTSQETPGTRRNAAQSVRGAHHRTRPNALFSLPIEMVFEILSHLSLRDLARLQRTCGDFYNFILTDRTFLYFNTVKFFMLYYRDFIFVPFLLPYVHPRFSFYAPPNHQCQYPNGDDRAGNTAFHLTCANGHADAVQRFLLLAEDGTYDCCTVPASRYNNEAMQVLRLKEENSACRLVDMVNDEPNTALHYISIVPENTQEEDVLAVAAMLLREGCSDYRKLGRAGNTPLAEAAQHGKLKMVQLILDEIKLDLVRAKVSAWGIEKALLPLALIAVNGPDRHFLSERSRMELTAAQAQRTHHVDWKQFSDAVSKDVADYINAKNNYQETAVIMSARSSVQTLDYLLDQGGDANTHRRNESLLHMVCSGFHLDRQEPTDFARYHDGRSAVALENLFFQPAMHHASLSELAEDEEVDRAEDERVVIQCLLRYGADPRLVHSPTGMQPIHMAAFWGNLHAIDVLITVGKVDPNRERNARNQWLPLHYACDEGQIWAIQALVKHGACLKVSTASTVEATDTNIEQQNEDHTMDEDDRISVSSVSSMATLPAPPPAAPRVRSPPAPLQLVRSEYLRKKVAALTKTVQ